MAHLRMASFDWGRLNELIARPPSRMPAAIARFLQGDPSFRSLLRSEDWYAGKSPREAREVDGLVWALFKQKKWLKLKPLNNERGVLLEIHEIATGALEVDDDGRNTPRAKYLHVRDVEPAPEGLAPELSEMSCRPFRHPSWDPLAYREQWKHKNPFIDGIDAMYIADYSVHSPEQVLLIRDELERVSDRVLDQLGLVKSEEVRIAMIENFDDELVRPIEEAANAGRAICVDMDC